MPSSEEKYKSFSSCGSQLSVVSLYFPTGFGVYISYRVTDIQKDFSSFTGVFCGSSNVALIYLQFKE
jgi:hypothetical protein